MPLNRSRGSNTPPPFGLGTEFLLVECIQQFPSGNHAGNRLDLNGSQDHHNVINTGLMTSPYSLDFAGSTMEEVDFSPHEPTSGRTLKNSGGLNVSFVFVHRNSSSIPRLDTDGCCTPALHQRSRIPSTLNHGPGVRLNGDSREDGDHKVNILDVSSPHLLDFSGGKIHFDGPSGGTSSGHPLNHNAGFLALPTEGALFLAPLHLLIHDLSGTSPPYRLNPKG